MLPDRKEEIKYGGVSVMTTERKIEEEYSLKNKQSAAWVWWAAVWKSEKIKNGGVGRNTKGWLKLQENSDCVRVFFFSFNNLFDEGNETVKMFVQEKLMAQESLPCLPVLN